MHLHRTLLTFTAALALGLACGKQGPRAPAGETRACPNGGSIVVADCSTVVRYDAQRVEADLSVMNWAKAEVSTSKEVLREVNDGFAALDQEYQQACAMYNACAIDSAEFGRRTAAASEREREVRACTALAGAGADSNAYREVLRCLHHQAVPPAKDDSLALSFAVQALRSGAAAPETLHGGETLKTGDKLVFGVTVSRPAHVYILQRTGPERRLEVLFPNTAISSVVNPLPAGEQVRLPPGGANFKVNDKDIGREEVFVIASSQPISDLARALEALRGGDAGQTKAVQTQVGDLFAAGQPTTAACDRTRGLDIESETCPRSRGISIDDSSSGEDPFFRDKPASLRARSEPWDDTIVQVFSFEHVK